MAGERHLTDGDSDGTKIGQSATEKLGFWGKSPVARPSVTWPNTATALGCALTAGAIKLPPFLLFQ